MRWIALFLIFDGFITNVHHPEASGHIYIAAGLFAIAESLIYRHPIRGKEETDEHTT